MAIEKDAELALIGVGLLLIAYIIYKASGVVDAVVGGVADLPAKAVLGVGDVLGVPRTNPTQCATDMGAGDTLGASVSCPAGTFLPWVMTRVKAALFTRSQGGYGDLPDLGLVDSSQACDLAKQLSDYGAIAKYCSFSQQSAPGASIITPGNATGSFSDLSGTGILNGTDPNASFSGIKP